MSSSADGAAGALDCWPSITAASAAFLGAPDKRWGRGGPAAGVCVIFSCWRGWAAPKNWACSRQQLRNICVHATFIPSTRSLSAGRIQGTDDPRLVVGWRLRDQDLPSTRTDKYGANDESETVTLSGGRSSGRLHDLRHGASRSRRRIARRPQDTRPGADQCRGDTLASTPPLLSPLLAHALWLALPSLVPWSLVVVVTCC